MHDRKFQDFVELIPEAGPLVPNLTGPAGSKPVSRRPFFQSVPARVAHWVGAIPGLCKTALGYGLILLRYGAVAFCAWLVSMVLLIGSYGIMPPPGSALMAVRWMNGTKIDQRWVGIERISPNLVRAVITSEDGRFCRHWGIDPKEILAAIRRSHGGLPRGASTISMQLAKNLFLWPSKSYLRKVLEVSLTFAMELLWSKRRIMEVYLNVVEWGPGVFGAEAAARHHFGIHAKKLSAHQASLLAVSLPNPLKRKARAPSSHVLKVASVVRKRMKRGRSVASCVLPRKRRR